MTSSRSSRTLSMAVRLNRARSPNDLAGVLAVLDRPFCCLHGLGRFGGDADSQRRQACPLATTAASG